MVEYFFKILKRFDFENFFDIILVLEDLDISINFFIWEEIIKVIKFFKNNKLF